MPIDHNKAIVLQFYKAFDDRQIEQALELLAPNFTARMAGIPQPLNGEDFKQFGMSFYLAFSQGQHVFDEIVVAGDKVVTCGTFTATHLGEFQGLPPTGKQIKLAVMHIDRTAFNR
jgi:predicted ester cyclase